MKFIYNIFLSLNLATTSIIGCSVAAINHKNQVTPHKLYVLGDSLSDNGSMANILSSTIKFHNVKFQAPFYNNSITNGMVAADILAHKLGTNLVTAWDSKTIGNNYAVDGAQAAENSYSWTNRLFLNRYSLQHQEEKLLKEHSLTKTDDILIMIGGDDLLSAMDQKDQATQDLIINNAVASEKTTIESLISNGAKNIVISSNPNISVIPRFLNTDKEHLALSLSNCFFKKWNETMNDLKQKYQNIKLVPYNLNASIPNLLQNFKKLGKDIIHASVSWTTFDLLFNLRPKYINGVTAATMSDNFFFDDVHPNKWGHEQVGNELFKIFNQINNQ